MNTDRFGHQYTRPPWSGTDLTYHCHIEMCEAIASLAPSSVAAMAPEPRPAFVPSPDADSLPSLGAVGAEAPTSRRPPPFLGDEAPWRDEPRWSRTVAELANRPNTWAVDDTLTNADHRDAARIERRVRDKERTA